jgi:hypothetical protein
MTSIQKPLQLNAPVTTPTQGGATRSVKTYESAKRIPKNIPNEIPLETSSSMLSVISKNMLITIALAKPTNTPRFQLRERTPSTNPPVMPITTLPAISPAMLNAVLNNIRKTMVPVMPLTTLLVILNNKRKLLSF